ncbi:MAG: hypothetical protein AAF611_09730 [Bacteroidota bacterium]
MKKKSLQTLRLNKKSISNLFENRLTGGSSAGTDTLENFNCRTSDQSFCDCNSEACNDRTIEECEW